MNPVAAVITAAGSSRRMGGGDKKEYRRLDGRPVLAGAILPFLPLCQPIVVTVPPGDAPLVRGLLSPHLDPAAILLAEGGSSRQESVYLGLLALERAAGPGYTPRSVLIHDGARPWVDRALIERVVAGVDRHGACIPVLEVTEALKRVEEDGRIREHLDRRPFALAQTPQGFRFPEILEAHRRARRTDRTWYDDAEIYASLVAPVYAVPGERGNCKVTFTEDLEGACG